MSFSPLSSPLIFCEEYPDCSNIEVPLPFGLPTFNFSNPCCEGLNVTLDQLEGLLRPLEPFLKLLGCAVKLVSIVLAIPETIGPPPDIHKLVELVQNVADFITQCLPYILSLVPILPTAIIAFCQMLQGIARLILSILRCLKRVFQISVSIIADSLALNLSPDPFLQKQGICLQNQTQILNQALISKLGGLLNILSLINMILDVLFAFIPPLKKIMTDQGLYPLVPNFEKGVMPPDFKFLDVLIVVFTAIEGASSICAGSPG